MPTSPASETDCCETTDCEEHIRKPVLRNAEVTAPLEPEGQGNVQKSEQREVSVRSKTSGLESCHEVPAAESAACSDLQISPVLHRRYETSTLEVKSGESQSSNVPGGGAKARDAGTMVLDHPDVKSRCGEESTEAGAERSALKIKRTIRGTKRCARKGLSTEGAPLPAGFIIALIRKPRLRRLHNVGRCGLVPCRDYANCHYLGNRVPKPEQFDFYCRKCWPGMLSENQ